MNVQTSFITVSAPVPTTGRTVLSYSSRNSTSRYAIATATAKYIDRGTNVSWQNPSAFIPFEKKTSGYLLGCIKKILNRSRDPILWKLDPLNFMSEPLRSAMHSFLTDLSLYDESCDNKIYDTTNILYASISQGPEFAKHLDSLKDYTLIRKTFRYLPEHEFDSFRTYSGIVDSIPNRDFKVSMLYRPNDLFRWVPPELNVFDYALDPVIQNREALNLFRHCCRSYLRRFCPKLTPPTELREVVRDTTTSCQEGKTWRLDDEPPAKVRGISKISHIPRELKQSRCASLEEYSSVLRIRWINSAVSKIISRDKRYAQKYDSEDLKKILDTSINPTKTILDTFHKCYDGKVRTSYCRDFSKEGLTKPRNLLGIMLEELHEYFPDELAFIEPHFFDAWDIETPQGNRSTARGHGLGMANELTTFMQFIIEDMNFTKRPNLRAGVDWSGYLNDDAAIIFDKWSFADEYKFVDMKTCSDLGLAFKTKASFLSVGTVVLCEIYSSAYSPKINNKDIFAKVALGTLYKAINASHARSLFSSIEVGVEPVQVQTVQEYWGFVLYPNEFKQIKELGGWIPDTEEKIRIDFAFQNDFDLVGHIQLRAYEAYKEVKFVPHPWDKKKVRTKVYNHYNPEYLRARGVNEFIDSNMMFRPSNYSEENTKCWRDYQKNLKAVFKKLISHKKQMTIKELYEIVASDEIDFDIIPPTNMRSVERSLPFLVQEGKKRDPYSSPGMKIEEQCFYEGSMKYIIEGKPSAGYTANVQYFSQTAAIRLRSQLKHFTKIGNKHILLDSIHFTPGKEVTNSWHNPNLIAMLCERHGLNGHCFLPSFIPLKKKERLFHRRAYYGVIDSREMSVLGELTPDQQYVMHLTKEAWNGNFRHLLEMTNWVKKLPEIGRLLDKTKSFSSEINRIIDIKIDFEENRPHISTLIGEESYIFVEDKFAETIIQINSTELPDFYETLEIDDTPGPVFTESNNFIQPQTFQIEDEIPWSYDSDIEEDFEEVE
jgi:hypothetical protein